jgi:hypothetical protein
MISQTPISIKNSGAVGNTPIALELAYGELALNYADGNFFYRTSSDTLASYKLVVPGIDKDVIFNDSGVYGTSAGLTFDKSTANLAVTQTVTTSKLNLNNISIDSVGTYSTANTNQVVIDVFPISTYRTAKYSVQLSSGSSYHSEEISIIHNGETPRIIEYGVIYSGGSSLGSFDVIINSGNVELLLTPVNASTTLKYKKTLMVT